MATDTGEPIRYWETAPTEFHFTTREVAGEPAEDDGVHFTLPLGYLPQGTKAGDHLRLSFVRDVDSREKTAKNVRRLLDKLTEEQDDDGEPEKFTL